MHCCGLFNGYTDWNEQVPESCNCIPEEEATSDVCMALPGNSFEVRHQMKYSLILKQLIK